MLTKTKPVRVRFDYRVDQWLRRRRSEFRRTADRGRQCRSGEQPARAVAWVPSTQARAVL